MLSDSGFLSNDIPFASFGHSHAVAVFVFIVLLGLSTLTALRLNDRENLIVTRISSLFLCFTVVAWTAITLALDRFNVDQSLPLSICNLFSLVAPFLFGPPIRGALRSFTSLFYRAPCKQLLPQTRKVGFQVMDSLSIGLFTVVW